MNNTTASTCKSQKVNIDDLAKIVKSIQNIQCVGKEWVLLSPDGKMWSGDVQHIFSVLAQHHPLLKLGFGEILRGE